MSRDTDIVAVIRHPVFLALSPEARRVYLSLLSQSTPGGTVSLDAMDAALAESPWSAKAVAELWDASLLDTEPADWAWWIRLPWIVTGAFVFSEAEGR